MEIQFINGTRATGKGEHLRFAGLLTESRNNAYETILLENGKIEHWENCKPCESGHKAIGRCFEKCQAMLKDFLTHKPLSLPYCDLYLDIKSAVSRLNNAA